MYLFQKVKDRLELCCIKEGRHTVDIKKSLSCRSKFYTVYKYMLNSAMQRIHLRLFFFFQEIRVRNI